MSKKAGRRVGHTGGKAAQKEAFLDAFAEHLTISSACKASGIGRSTVYEWRASDVAFAERWEEIDDEITERLEREAMRRAMEGVKQPVYQGGKQVGEVRKFSDRMLEMLLRARAPEKYRDRLTVTDEREEAAKRELEAKTEAELDEALAGIGDNVTKMDDYRERKTS